MSGEPGSKYRGLLLAATLLLVTWATTHVVATYTALSHTVDEPTHIALGLEWLESRTQRVHPENPPVSRIAMGLGPYLGGHRLPPEGLAPRRGVEVLYGEGGYQRNLVLARLGALPFFLLAVFLVWRWAHQLAGPAAAFLAAGFFCTLPPVMGHAGLATTDVPFMAMFAWAMWTGLRWIESPTPGRTLHFGLALGGAMATKFSALLFCPPALGLAWLLRMLLPGSADRGSRPWRGWILGGAGTVGLCFLVLWAFYGFSIGRVASIPGGQQVIAANFPDVDSLPRRVMDFLSVTPLPAADALYGFLFLSNHSKMGHLAYLLGEESQRGFAAFYPVAFAVKTPGCFLLMLLAGALALARSAGSRSWQTWAPLVTAAAVMATAMPTSIHMGLRHLLHIYPLLAVAVGVGGSALLRGRVRTGVVALLLLWQSAMVARDFPDYVASFNLLAGSEPGEVLVDSDLDWGQDVFQLREVCEQQDIEQLHIAYFGSVRLCDHGLPPLRWLQPGERVTGWVAVSEMYFRDHWHNTFDDPCDRSRRRVSTVRGGYDWLAAYEPVALAGRSIRVYHIPDG